MSNNQGIVCFAPSDWWGMNPSCTTHIMRRLAQHYEVLYINPFSSDIFGKGGDSKKRGWKGRILRKAKSLLKYLRSPVPGLHVFSPLFLPIQGKQPFDAINNTLLKYQIKIVCCWLGLKHPILWMENARAADAIDWIRHSRIVYHVSDLIVADNFIANQDKQREHEARISRESDLVICVSKSLYELKKTECRNVHYMPHGVDYGLFKNVPEDVKSAYIEGIPEPIIGYYGTMTANNDIEMMEYCARQLPQMSFVFAGQITTGDYSRLADLPNVYLLGKLPYEDIPALCHSFDVCMLQWKMTEWIRNCNPLKMFEYMASGNPIVSVEITEAKQYADVISIAKNKEEFCSAIEWEIENDTAERIAKRRSIASEHSWDNHVERITGMITQTETQG